MQNNALTKNEGSIPFTRSLYLSGSASTPGQDRDKDTINLLVFGEPKGQPRVMAFARKIGGKFVARVYTPGTAEHWKSSIADAVKEIGAVGIMLSGPIKLRLFCRFSRPKSHFRTGKRSHELRPDAPIYHTAKPDADNVTKAAKDALIYLGVWKDDSMVADSNTVKKYCRLNEFANTVIEISMLEDAE